MSDQFPSSSQADLIQASLRDQEIRSRLLDKSNDLFIAIYGPRAQQKYLNTIQLCTDTIYYILTTVLGSSSLGEEYVEMFSVGSDKLYPSVTKRINLVLLQVLFPKLVKDAFKKVKSIRIQNGETSSFKERMKIILQKIQKLPIKTFDYIFEECLNVHLAVFYLFGTYYHLSKRFLGITYIYPKKRTPNQPQDSTNYEILGILLLGQLFMKTGIYIDKKINQEEGGEEEHIPENEEIACEEHEMCTLCLCKRKDTTVTECGHLFCWYCIAEWCRNKPECPLCRQNISASRLCLLNNF